MIINSNNFNNINKMNKLPNSIKRGFNQTPETIRNSMNMYNSFEKRDNIANKKDISLSDKINGLNKLNKIKKGGGFGV